MQQKVPLILFYSSEDMERVDNVAKGFKNLVAEQGLQHVSEFLGCYGNDSASFLLIQKYCFTSMEVLNHNISITV